VHRRLPSDEARRSFFGERWPLSRAVEGEALADVDVLGLLEEADVPAHRSPLVLLLVRVSEQERELERLR
jgi:hypothetical protein